MSQCQKVNHDVKNYFIMSNIRSWSQKYVITSTYFMMSELCHNVKSMQWLQKVCHDVKKYVMTSKLWHYVKTTSSSKQIHYYVKKYVICVKNTSWCLKYVMTSKLRHIIKQDLMTLKSHDVKDMSDVKSTSWR